MLSSRSRVLAAVGLAMTPVLPAAAQSSVVVSPFVSYVPSAAANPLAGFSLTFGGTTGLAFRSGAEVSISNPPLDSTMTGGYRPWGADADAMLFLGGLGGGATVFQRSLSPYLFAGIGLTGGDSAGRNVVRHGWSYGLGATLPLGLHADLFAEARWRMPQYVLPTSQDAPDSKSAMRFGISFLVGSDGSRDVRPRRRHRMAEYEDDEPEVVAAAPAPAPQVVVVQPAPQPAAPPPQVVVVQQPAPPPAPVVVVSEPRRRRDRVVVVERGPVFSPTIVIGGGRDSRRSRSRSRWPHVVAPTVPIASPRKVELPRVRSTGARSTVQVETRKPQTTGRQRPARRPGGET